MRYLICILAGYFVGSVNPAYFLAKLRGFDIRQRGSGNAGASNALILFGKLRGILCALFDIAKAVFVIWVMGKLFAGLDYVFAVTSVACILGHIFPFYMRFKGGKGLACLGGTILAFDWVIFVIMLSAEIVVVLLTKYICFVPITASLVFPIIYGVLRHDILGAALLYIAAIVIFWRHRENFARIRKGTEARISFLWSKKEADRLKEVYKEDNN